MCAVPCWMYLIDLQSAGIKLSLFIAQINMIYMNTLTSKIRFRIDVWIWGIIVAYFFLLFFQMPSGQVTGLDPSWTYAIARAATEKLIFGKDVIFTCGPFGYLVVYGVALEQHFFSIIAFHTAVHLIFCVLLLLKILMLKSNIQKMALFFTILLAFLMLPGIEYEIIYTYLLLFSFDRLWEKKSIRWVSVILGGFAGFCLLTKFTIGVYILGSLSLLLIGKFYNSLNSQSSSKSSSTRLIYFLAITDCFLAATSVAFIFLNPTPQTSLNKILLCFAVASMIGAVIGLMQKRISVPFIAGIAKKAQNKAPRLVSLWRQIGGKGGFYISACFLVSLTILYSSPSLIDYLKNCLEFSGAFSSAMSTVGPNWELGLAVSELVIMAWLVILLAKEGNIGLALALTFVGYLAFKHGFVRHDLHSLSFFRSVPIIVWLCNDKIKVGRVKKISYLGFAYVLIVASIYINAYLNSLMPLQQIHFNKAANQLSHLFNLKGLQTQLNATVEADLAQVKLPENVRSLVGNKQIDIVPSEFSLAKANNLNWKPRFTFQSFSALTTLLDNRNLQSLSNSPREYIFYNFASIDGRHPFFDEPATFFYILCNYKLSPDVPELINLPGLQNLMLLERRSTSICSGGAEIQQTSISWNATHTLSLPESDGSILRAAVNIEYTIFGKIYKALFRTPPVWLNITDGENNNYAYRIIPENSENGVIISHLPKDEVEAFYLFQGYLPTPVKKLRFSTSNYWIFKPKIELLISAYNRESITSYELGLSQLLANLNEIKFGSEEQSSNTGFMDTTNTSQAEVLSGEDIIHLAGWAVGESKGEPQFVLLTYGEDNKPITVTPIGLPRPDVEQAFNNSSYKNSGWQIDLKAKFMPKGVYHIKAWIYNPASKSAHPLNGMYLVDIR